MRSWEYPSLGACETGPTGGPALTVYHAQTRAVSRAGGPVTEPKADVLGLGELGVEWEWEDSPEVSLVLVDSVEHAIELFNRHSPLLAASLISDDPTELQMIALEASLGFLQQNIRWAFSWSTPKAPTFRKGTAKIATQKVNLKSSEIPASRFSHCIFPASAAVSLHPAPSSAPTPSARNPPKWATSGTSWTS